MKTKEILVNRNAIIKDGVLKGHEGLVGGYVSSLDEVWITLDEKTTVIVKSKMIEQNQEEKKEQKRV